MKKDKMDFDDTETADDLNKAFVDEFGDLSDAEIDELYQNTFGKTAQ